MTRTAATWTVLDRDQLIFQARFGHRYGLKLARFYRRCDMLLRWFQLVAGGTAFFTLFGDHESALRIAGGVVALTAAIDLIWDPADKAALCERNAERWAELDSRASGIDDEQLSREAVQLTAHKAPTLDMLSTPVMNDLLREFGLESQRDPETWWQRAVVRRLF